MEFNLHKLFTHNFNIKIAHFTTVQFDPFVYRPFILQTAEEFRQNLIFFIVFCSFQQFN